MKILQINNVYGKGSTGKITKDIHGFLQENGYDSVVLYGRGKKTTDKNVFKICGEFEAKVYKFFSFLSGLPYGGCPFSTFRIIKRIKKEKPDVVHLQCLNGNFVNVYQLVKWLNANEIKTVLTLHAEFMYTANCSHAFDCDKWKTGCGNCECYREATGSLFKDRTNKSYKKMFEAFFNFKNLTVVSVSPWLKKRAELSPILKDKNHEVILNGLDTSVFNRKESKIRKIYGLTEDKIIFHATPNFNADKEHIKGGYYVIELAKALKDYKFIVAGMHEKNISVPENMVLLDKLESQTALSEWYSVADVSVIASKRETFSMVVAESLCCGTPVVGFKAGAPEKIAIKEYSQFVPYGDVEALTKAVESMINNVFDKGEIEKVAKKNYSKDVMAEKYIKVYTKLLN